MHLHILHTLHMLVLQHVTFCCDPLTNRAASCWLMVYQQLTRLLLLLLLLSPAGFPRRAVPPA
jgi:hypothetical protein